MLGGIQVNEPNHEIWAQALKKYNFNTTSTTVYAHQGDWDSSNLWYELEIPSVISEIRAAKAEGLKAVLIARVALDHAFSRNEFLWHGMIMPKTRSELDEWFSSYKYFVVELAKVAQRENVDLFGIGSEMNSLSSTTKLETLSGLSEFYLDTDKRQKEVQLISNRFLEQNLIDTKVQNTEDIGKFSENLTREISIQRDWAKQTTWAQKPDTQRLELINQRREYLEKKWREIIASVREVYSGKITYAANFDQYKEVGFWNALDIVGINAYFSLADEDKICLNTLSEHKSAWKKVFKDIRKYLADNNIKKKVLFSELGYTARKCSTAHPWASEGYKVVHREDSPEDVMFFEQLPLSSESRYQALKSLQMVSPENRDIFSGLLYWKFSTIPAHKEIEPFVIILDNNKKDKSLSALQLFNK